MGGADTPGRVPLRLRAGVHGAEWLAGPAGGTSTRTRIGGGWSPDLKAGRRERVTGIEPALSAWEADVLPLNYTRGTVHASPHGSVAAGPGVGGPGTGGAA